MVKAVFLDRDGVINELIYYPEQGVVDSPFTVEQLRLLPGVGVAINKFHEMGYKVILASNQPSIAKGYLSEETFDKIRRKMKEDLAKADKFEADFVKSVDNYLEKHGLDAPIDSLPELRDSFEGEEILALDLQFEGIKSVIWATGYKFDFSLVKLPVFDEDGYPVQKRGVTEFPGLYFIGLPFLHTMSSGLLVGVGNDTAYVAEHIYSRIQTLA